MSKVTTQRWGAYTRNQEAVAAAIARKEYTDMTPTGVGVVDEFFALMDQVGILDRLAVEGQYQRRLIPCDRWNRLNGLPDFGQYLRNQSRCRCQPHGQR